MSDWLDQKTDMEKVIEILTDISNILQSTAVAGGTGVDSTTWATFLTAFTIVPPKISALTTEENIRKIKIKKILKDIDSFLTKISQIN